MLNNCSSILKIFQLTENNSIEVYWFNYAIENYTKIIITILLISNKVVF